MKPFVGWRCFFVLLCPLVFLLPLLFSVFELHQSSTPADSVKKISKKFDHLVLGPAAGQGLPNRLQCQGVKALNKTRFSSPSRSLNVGRSIAFVTVFTIYNNPLDSVANDRLSNLVPVVGNASYSKSERSMAILNVFINFIQETMPQSNVIILTDPQSDLSVHRDSVTVYPIKGEYSRDKLMLQRIMSYIVRAHRIDKWVEEFYRLPAAMFYHLQFFSPTFLKTRLAQLSQKREHTTHYIFTDSDIAVVDDLGHIFDSYQNFHLALTFRNNKDQPVNSGFIAVRGTAEGILRAKVFLEEVLKVYSSKYMKASRMLGDQLALAWVVKSHPLFNARRFTKAQPFIEDIGSTSVLFLPCATYNWTPPEGAGQFHGMPLDVKVVHFKGSRKRLMLEAWKFFNSSSDISDMLCLVLSSGRTKYDF